MNEPLSILKDAVPAKYQHWVLLLVAALPYLTRAAHALMSGRGLVGIFSGVFFGTNTPSQNGQATPVKINTLNTLSLLLGILSLGLLAAGCAGLDRNVLNGENLAADTVIGARHTFNVWYKTERANAVTAGNTNRVAQLDSMRDYVRQQTYRAGVALQTVDSIRLEVEKNSASTNLSALQIAADSLPLASSNLTWAVKYFMTGRLSPAVQANPSN